MSINTIQLHINEYSHKQWKIHHVLEVYYEVTRVLLFIRLKKTWNKIESGTKHDWEQQNLKSLSLVKCFTHPKITKDVTSDYTCQHFTCNSNNNKTLLNLCLRTVIAVLSESDRRRTKLYITKANVLTVHSA